MAKLTKTIFGVVDGEIYPREIEAGEDCPPGLEAYAASIDAIDVEDIEGARLKAEAEAKAAAEAEAKAAKKAPENK